MTEFICHKHGEAVVLVEPASYGYSASLHRCLSCAEEARRSVRRAKDAFRRSRGPCACAVLPEDLRGAG